MKPSLCSRHTSNGSFRTKRPATDRARRGGRLPRRRPSSMPVHITTLATNLLSHNGGVLT